jgi:hypothetical protein
MTTSTMSWRVWRTIGVQWLSYPFSVLYERLTRRQHICELLQSLGLPGETVEALHQAAQWDTLVVIEWCLANDCVGPEEVRRIREDLPLRPFQDVRMLQVELNQWARKVVTL